MVHPPARREAASTAWLYEEPSESRLPLHAARHPVLDDVLLATSPEAAAALGYGEPRLLGYLEPRAPVTGALGVGRYTAPWVNRWGLPV